MEDTSSHKPVARFGAFELDFRAGEVRKNGRKQRLRGQPFRVLAILLENAGHPVSREALCKWLWPDDTFVDFDHSLGVAISKVREALGDSAESPRLLETLRGRGYRFIAPVTWEDATGPVPSAHSVLHRPPRSQWDKANQKPAYPDPPRGSVVRSASLYELDCAPQGVDRPSHRPAEIMAFHASSPEEPSPALSRHPAAAGHKVAIFPSRRRRVPVIFAVAAMVVAGVWMARRTSSRQTINTAAKAVERQLAECPPGDLILGGSISPDGRTLAYVDRSGVHLSTIDAGGDRTLPLPEPLQHQVWDVNWFPDGERLLATAGYAGSGPSTLWSISIFDGAVRRLWEGGEAAISPDGAAIAYIAPFVFGAVGGHELWIREITNGGARIIAESKVDQFISPAWSPEGQRVAYIRKTQSGAGIESVRVSGPPRRVVLWNEALGPTLPSLCWCADWRIIFVAGAELSSGHEVDNLWQLRLRPHPLAPLGKPSKLTHSTDAAYCRLAPNAGGRRITFVRCRMPSHGYLAEVKPDGTLGRVRGVIESEGSDWASEWFPKGRELLLRVDRYGESVLYRKTLGQAPVEITRAPEYGTTAIGPAGRWVIYSFPGKRDAAGNPISWRYMRITASGGTPHFMFETSRQGEINCPRHPGVPCILGEVLTNQAGDSVTHFYAFDPIAGKGNELAKVPVGQFNVFGSVGWDISPSGSRLAVPASIPDWAGSAIRIVQLQGGRSETVRLRGRWMIESVTWGPDDKTLFATLWSNTFPALAKIGSNGIPHVLLQWRPWGLLDWPQVSPDGKYVSFTAQNWEGDMWMLENF